MFSLETRSLCSDKRSVTSLMHHLSSVDSEQEQGRNSIHYALFPVIGLPLTSSHVQNAFAEFVRESLSL